MLELWPTKKELNVVFTWIAGRGDAYMGVPCARNRFHERQQFGHVDVKALGGLTVDVVQLHHLSTVEDNADPLNCAGVMQAERPGFHGSVPFCQQASN